MSVYKTVYLVMLWVTMRIWWHEMVVRGLEVVLLVTWPVRQLCGESPMCGSRRRLLSALDVNHAEFHALLLSCYVHTRTRKLRRIRCHSLQRDVLLVPTNVLNQHSSFTHSLIMQRTCNARP
jgi:hypothetical protein